MALDASLMKMTREYHARRKDERALRLWIEGYYAGMCPNKHLTSVRFCERKQLKKTCKKCGEQFISKNWVKGIVEKWFVNRKYMDENGIPKAIPMTLPPHAYDALFQILYTGDMDISDKKKLLLLQPRGTYKTYVVSLAAFIHTTHDHIDGNMMVVSPAKNQFENFVGYLMKAYQDCTDLEMRHLIDNVLRPRDMLRERKVVFDGQKKDKEITLHATYTSKTTDTIASKHVRFMIIDECGKIDYPTMQEILPCLDPGGVCIAMTTPQPTKKDWTRNAFLACKFRNILDMAELPDETILTPTQLEAYESDLYVRDALIKANLDVKAFTDWNVYRVSIDDVINNKGRHPITLYTWDIVEQEKINSLKEIGGYEKFLCNIMVQWPDATGGSIFPEGLFPVYARYYPGARNIAKYNRVVVGWDVGESDCPSIMWVWGRYNAPDGRKIVRMLHLEEVKTPEIDVQIDRCVDLCGKFNCKEVCYDNQGLGKSVTNVLGYLRKNNTAHLANNITWTPARWADVVNKHADYQFIYSMMVNHSIEVPDPNFLLFDSAGATEDMIYYTQQASRLKTANEEFISLIWLPVGKDGKRMTVKKTGRYADYPDSASMGLRLMIEGSEMDDIVSMHKIKGKTPSHEEPYIHGTMTANRMTARQRPTRYVNRRPTLGIRPRR